MKRIFLVILGLVLLALAWQLFNLYRQNKKLGDTLSAIDVKTDFFKKENSELQADLEYYAKPENLEKELRSRFNYKKPGEKLIIIVPPKEATSSQ
ncbi:MAG: septum formation initiator family protein [bacterium]|nr:septum formation initiator family protein [bacterium]